MQKNESKILYVVISVLIALIIVFGVYTIYLYKFSENKEIVENKVQISQSNDMNGIKNWKQKIEELDKEIEALDKEIKDLEEQKISVGKSLYLAMGTSMLLNAYKLMEEKNQSMQNEWAYMDEDKKLKIAFILLPKTEFYDDFISEIESDIPDIPNQQNFKNEFIKKELELYKKDIDEINRLVKIERNLAEKYSEDFYYMKDKAIFRYNTNKEYYKDIENKFLIDEVGKNRLIMQSIFYKISKAVIADFSKQLSNFDDDTQKLIQEIDKEIREKQKFKQEKQELIKTIETSI